MPKSPSTAPVMVSFRLDPKLRDAVHALASKERRTIAGQMEIVIEKGLAALRAESRKD